MNIVNARNIKEKPMTALIYASPGTGKTTAIGELPGKTLILDIDHSSDVLAGKDNIDICYIKPDLSNLPETLAELESGACKGYDNIAVDNLSEMEKCMLTEYGKLGKNNGAPELQHYNQANYKIVDYVRRFRALPGNTIFTAWEDIIEIVAPSGEKYSKFMPMLGRKTREQVCGLCNVVGHLEVAENEDGTERRAIRLDSSKSAYAKDQVAKRKWAKASELIVKGVKK